jgi:DNA polymerase-3 subunit gamma/tau
MARLLAQALNAPDGPRVDFDPESPTAQAIATGRCLDVIEIDGASNNSVDQVRQLREDCQYAPAQCRFKIYIIDEVHMLSTAAFNALLKTLEEPPAHVKFIFATTESQKVLPTIVSRCQRFEFRPIAQETLVACLQRIVQGEGVQAEDLALEAIARLAMGGMRDAQSILDQMIAFCGPNLKEKDVLDMYGLVGKKDLEALAEHLLHARMAQAVQTARAWTEAGKDLARTLSDLQDCVRQRWLSSLMDPAKDRQGPLGNEGWARLLQSLNDSQERIKTSLDAGVCFEVALLKAAEASRTRCIDTLLRRLDGLSLSEPSKGTPTADPTAMQAGLPAAKAQPTPAASKHKAAAASGAFGSTRLEGLAHIEPLGLDALKASTGELAPGGLQDSLPDSPEADTPDQGPSQPALLQGTEPLGQVTCAQDVLPASTQRILQEKLKASLQNVLDRKPATDQGPEVHF